MSWTNFKGLVLKAHDTVVVMTCLGSKQEDGMYKNTLDLPKTKFDIRANAVMREPEIQKRWEENRVYERVYQRNSGVNNLLSFYWHFLNVQLLIACY